MTPRFARRFRVFIRDHFAPEMHVPNPLFSSGPTGKGVFKESWILCSS
jgi:hypothetical protein